MGPFRRVNALVRLENARARATIRKKTETRFLSFRGEKGRVEEGKEGGKTNHGKTWFIGSSRV